MHTKPFIIICTFCYLLCSQVFSQEEITKEYTQALQDVFQTELVYPQEKNEFQFTLLPSFQKFNDYEHIIIPLIVEFGISDSWQFEFEWNAYQNKFINSDAPAEGIGDLEIGTKYSFMNIANSNIHTAIGFEIGLPLGDENKELGEGQIEYEPYLILALDIPELNHAQLFAQGGIGFLQTEADKTSNEESETHEINFNGGFFIPFNTLILTSELNWNSSYSQNENESQLYLTPGVVWNLSGGWETGVGVPIGLNNESDNYRIIAMITYEFGLGEDDN